MHHRRSPMPSSVNGIELYYERAGQGPPVLFLNGSGSTLADVAPLIAGARRTPGRGGPRPTGPGAQRHTSGALHHGGLRHRCPRAPRRGGVAGVPRRRGELRWHGRPGAGRHRSRPRGTPGVAVHVAGRGGRLVVSRCTNWHGLAPRRRGAESEAAPRLPVLRGMAGDASRRPRARGHHGEEASRRRCPTRSAAARPNSSRPAAITTSGTGSGVSRARHSWRPAGSTGSPPSPTARPS